MKKLVILFVFSLFVFPCLTNAATFGISRPSNNLGLVGYWTFDGKDTIWTSDTTATTLDKSGNGTTGTLTNMIRTINPAVGKIGQGLGFDGVNDYVNIPSAPSLNAPYTISLWFYPRVFGVQQGLVDFAYNTSNSPSLYLHANNRLDMEAFNTVGFRSFSNKVFTTADLNKWWHVVAIVSSSTDPTQWKFYINGIDNGLDSSDSYGSYRAPSTAWALGSIYNNAHFFNGFMDDVRIYNRSLTQTDVTQLYNIGASNKTATSPKVAATSTCSVGLSCGLVGYWTFDGKDVVNGVILDKSGSGNNGNTINISTSTFYKPGKIGQGLDFDGVNDYVDILSTTNLDNIWDSGGTVSFWVKLRSGGEGLGAGYWVGRSVWTLFALEGCSSNSGIEFNIAWSGGVAKWRDCFSSTDFNKWHHIVLSYDADSTSNVPMAYVDNVLVTLPQVVAPSGTRSTDVGSETLIGGNFATSRTSDGIIDDMRMYNRLLSRSEITQLYNMGASTKVSTSQVNTLRPGLVGYWTFDGKDVVNGVALDRSGNSNSANLINISTSTFYKAGKIGQGFNFDGIDDYASASSTNGSLDFGTGSFSFSLWVRMNKVFPASEVGIFVKLMENDSIGWKLVTGASNTLAWRVRSGPSDFIYVYSPSLQIDTWYHVTGVVDRSANKSLLYINGVLATAGSDITGFGTFDTNRNLFMGTSRADLYYSNISLDDVRVYNYALSAKETLQLYNMGK